MNAPAPLDIDGMCQRTLDHLVALVRVWTPDAGVVYVNRAWRELTGSTLEENVGDGWLQAVHEEDRSRVLMVLATSGATRLSYRLRAADGTVVPVSDSAMAWTNEPSGQPSGLIHTVTAGAAGDAADPVRSMSAWAHELRGPLNAILGWSDLLSNGENEPEILQRGLKAIANNARQQAMIIKRMTE